MEIRCKKGDCHFNTGCSCNARTIEVEKAVTCGSYEKDNLKDNLIIENGNIFAVADELIAKNVIDVPLSCRVKVCLYNRDEKCYANGITVIDGEVQGHEEAECATFVTKP